MNGLDLFSGLGGISLALRDYVRPVAYCEIEPYCQSVLLQRMQEGHLPKAPIWDDVRTLPINSPRSLGTIDIIYGGFPCQGISIAGHGKGLADERSGLFFEIIRLAKEIKPTFIFLENTRAILQRGGLQVIEELASIGFSTRWTVKSCEEIGSPQKRERWFCLAYCDCSTSREANKSPKSIMLKEKTRLQSTRQDRRETSRTYWEENKCPLLGMDYGLSFELDRAKSLGNSVCPQQARKAFEILMGII